MDLFSSVFGLEPEHQHIHRATAAFLVDRVAGS